MGASSTIGRNIVAAGAVAAWLLAIPTFGVPHDGGTATLSKGKFPAKGRNEAILEVSRPGRYALTVKSKQGAALQIVDRMAGPGESAGISGEKDGRLDLLLDSGRYKVVVTSPEKGKGDASLEVHSFTEMHRPEPPVLVEFKPVRDSLEDFQQRSWWVQVPQRRTVTIEAQGRDLQDLRLWKDGAWILEDMPVVRIVEPVKGQLERSCILVADLNPGSYLLTAYGGPPQDWAKETGQHLFSLRFGIPALPASCRVDAAISPFGADRYLVAKGANTFLVQLAEKKDLRLDVASYATGDNPLASEAAATISKQSADPECAIRRTITKDSAIVTVSGAPGERYLFQCFDQRDLYTFNPRVSQDYRISTLHSGYMDDNIDATCILVSSKGGDPHWSPHADDVLHIGKEAGWARRFNLLGTCTLFFFVEEAGDYQIQSSGTGAQYRFEPFMISRPKDYKTPDFQESGAAFSLDRGYWVLTIQPKLQGILKVALQQKGFFQRLKEWVVGGDEASPTPAKGACTLEKVHLEPDVRYTLHMNRQEGVNRGLLVSPLPLRLEDPLPLALKPGKEASLSFSVEKDSRLQILTLREAKYTCILDGAPWTEVSPLKAGPHTVTFRNDGAKTTLFTLRAFPEARLPDAPPQFLDAAAKTAMAMTLPALREGKGLFFDFGVKEKKALLVTVDSPGLYRIETTGLLKTSLTVRSAVRTKLFSAEANGVGRNALLSQYLKEGDYLLLAQTLDKSAGHAGIRLARTEVTEAGELSPGREAKADVAANRSMVYTFQIAEAGKYSVKTMGQGRFFPSRLEDAEGWPLVAPGIPSNITTDLAKGGYRFMSLPLEVDTLRLTTVARVADARRVEGKGPHALALNEKVENRWREPQSGAGRARDVYALSVPAPLDGTVRFSEATMQAHLVKLGGGAPEVLVPPGKGWSGPLAAGEYRLEVECGRLNDLVDYTVEVTTAQLAPGLQRSLSAPGQVEVRLAKDSVVELSSHGPLDVRGFLYTALPEAPETPSGDGAKAKAKAPVAGELVDFSDDSYNDWNFRMARRLPAGRYLLTVDPVGGKTGTTTVAMAAPAESLRDPLPLRVDTTLDLGGAIAVLPLESGADADLYSVRVTGASQYGCILEKVGTGEPAALVTRTGREIAFDVPLVRGASYRLRIWSADHQSETARLVTRNTVLPTLTAEELREARSVKACEVPDESWAVARVRVGRGGTFTTGAAEGINVSPAPEKPLLAAEEGLVALPAGDCVVRWDLSSGESPRVKLVRRILKDGEDPLRVRLPRAVRQNLDVEVSATGPTILSVTAPGGQAAGVFTGSLLGETTSPCLSHSYLAGEKSVAVVFPGAPGETLLWDPREDAPEFSEFDVQAHGFKEFAQEGTLAPGAHQGALEKGGGKQWNLPPGGKQVDLALEAGLAAYLWEGNAVDAVAFADAGPSHASFATTATHVAVVSLAGERAAFQIAIAGRPESSFPTPLIAGKPFEKVFAQGGTVRLQVENAEGGAARVLSVAGTDVSAQWMDAEGILHPGACHEIRGRGELVITHGPGLVKAWLGENGQELEGRWGLLGSDPVLPLAPPVVTTLEGKSRWFGITVEKPSALHVSADCPAVAGLSSKVEGPVPLTASGLLPSGGNARTPPLAVVEGYPDTRLDATLEPGNYVVGLRSLDGETLHGTAEISLAEVIPIEKTFGPERMIRGGETQTFAFAMKEKGTLGIGLNADREVLSCHLLRSDGTALGSGSQQFVDVAAGTYLLRVSLPPGENPVKFTPIIVGLEPPGSGPPEEVLREFLQGLGLNEP
jgi:hypothetical protein